MPRALRLRSRSRSRDQHGAAAVEFALVSTIFFTFLFGIIQYGLYFNDSLNVRQGIREAARLGVVETFPTCAGAADDWAKLKCTAKDQVGALTGPTYVKVVAPDGWARGKRLLVCAMVKSDGGVGLLPMPNGGIISSKTQMSIEKNSAPTGSASADAPPSGTDWSWCS